MQYDQVIAKQVQVRPEQVAATIDMLDSGNTIPFIARYRKERTGGLDEEQLRQISAALDSLRTLDERRQTIVAAIEAQGKLTPELRQKIVAAETRTALEDLYQPYKTKRRTRNDCARAGPRAVSNDDCGANTAAAISCYSRGTLYYARRS
jgi:uncharacterized protein